MNWQKIKAWYKVIINNKGWIFKIVLIWRNTKSTPIIIKLGSYQICISTIATSKILKIIWIKDKLCQIYRTIIFHFLLIMIDILKFKIIKIWTKIMQIIKWTMVMRNKQKRMKMKWITLKWTKSSSKTIYMTYRW